MKKLFVMLLVGANLFSWEINTYRAIDRTALENVENLNTFVSDVKLFESYEDEIFEDYDMTYFKYIEKCEKNGLSEETIKQDFLNTNYKSLLEAGSILEDAQWPHWKWPNYIPNPIVDIVINAAYNKVDQAHGRFINHFYNPQRKWPGGGDARIWALMGSGNDYSYIDAMKYFAKGFSEPSEVERRKYQAKMFVSVGHLLHVKPLHVRKGA